MPQSFPRYAAVLLLVLSLAGLICPPCLHADETKRLILTDGSYQVVVKWEVVGDRVRYLSAERYTWEEIPKSLVDWNATEKWEADSKAGKLKSDIPDVKPDADDDVRTQDVLSPPVAPGLRLPETGGIFLLDSFQGQPQLVELSQNSGDVNKEVKGNILKNTINPLAGFKQSIELKGAHSIIQGHTARPTLYVNFDPKADATAKPAGGAGSGKYGIVKLESKKDIRVIGTINVAITGKISQKEALIACARESMTGGWVKLTPNADLPPGEYAVVEFLGDNDINLFLWDFGINPSAPANPSAWKPTPVAGKQADEKPPELQNRKKD
ncbi:MAG TPA: hypothetical protein VK473_16680 [Terriglobales bacterium]|nr:hypothetical protein [Terriglobales bacterium]